MTMTQYERSENLLEIKDAKVSRLLKELEAEVIDMVPMRHYQALVKCLQQTHIVLENLAKVARIKYPKQSTDAETVLGIIDMHLNQHKIGEVRYVKEIAIKKSRGRPPKKNPIDKRRG